MCIPIRQLDSATRRRVAIGNSCLAVGLLLWVFRASIPIPQDLRDAVCGLLIGLSIAINLLTIAFHGRCGRGIDEQGAASAPPQ